MATSRTDIPTAPIAEFCRRHHMSRLAIFGLALRDDFRQGSDLDVLVEFEPGHVPGLSFFRMQSELSTLLGRRVDLNTPQFLSPYFRDKSRMKLWCSMPRHEALIRYRPMLDPANRAKSLIQGWQILTRPGPADSFA